MRAIDLHSLWERDKWLPLPGLVYAQDLFNAGGYYVTPQDGEHTTACGICAPANNGVIVVNAQIWLDSDDGSDDDIYNTIAHEWRHHWQIHTGVKLPGSRWSQVEGCEYWESVAQYFQTPTEFDALVYANGVCSTALMAYSEEVARKYRRTV